MRVKMYVVGASHPCWAVARALELKGLGYKRVEWPPTMHVPMQRLRFGRGTVPGVVIDGERVIGSRTIMHRLDELVPSPPLYPANGEARARVEELDRWGEEVLQALARRLIWWTLRNERSAIATYAEDSQLPIPDLVTKAMMPIIFRIEWSINRVSDESTRRDLAELPGHLDHIDQASREGLLGGRTPNAADLQIGSSIALLRTMGDVRPLLQGRPAEALATREFSSFPGATPAGTFPAEWIPRT